MKSLGSESPRSEPEFHEDREGISIRVGAYAHDASLMNAGRFSWIAS
jgi:hypothetical protein